ncbi:MAG: pyridoxamine 5'-phosphate oxidase family protein [Candidatus Ornithomonoglobus sp.]
MTKQEIFKLMNENPVFYLATEEGDQPRVRGMLLYRADEDGIIFHTAATKDVFKQLADNPKAEVCFFGNGVQVRVSGILELIDDEGLRREIYEHPTRGFLREWKKKGIGGILQIFRMKNGTAVTWTMESNFDPKVPIQL